MRRLLVCTGKGALLERHVNGVVLLEASSDDEVSGEAAGGVNGGPLIAAGPTGDGTSDFNLTNRETGPVDRGVLPVPSECASGALATSGLSPSAPPFVPSTSSSHPPPARQSSSCMPDSAIDATAFYPTGRSLSATVDDPQSMTEVRGSSPSELGVRVQPPRAAKLK